MAAIPSSMHMTPAEVSLGLTLLVAAFLCFLVSACTVDAPFGVHMAVLALASIAGFVAIPKRHEVRATRLRRKSLGQAESQPRTPAWIDRLDQATLKSLAAYVNGLGRGR